MYFLIGIWGGERRLYAAIKFFLYTLFGSVVMLVGILVLLRPAPDVRLDGHDRRRARSFPPALQGWIFLAFFLGFAIKVPMFPFHTWLPDAHVEAPTAGSVILAGVLLKMGTYGFLRFSLPLLPDAARRYAPVMVVLALVSIVYGALVSLMQKDMKKLIAYSSVSHMGFVMLGLFALTPMAVKGAVLQMINHGLSTGALFLIVGVLYERRHTRLIAEFGGLSVAHAGLRRRLPDHDHVVDRPSRPQRLHRRVHDPDGHLPGELALDGGRRDRHHPRGRLHALALPAGHVREARAIRPTSRSRT